VGEQYGGLAGVTAGNPIVVLQFSYGVGVFARRGGAPTGFGTCYTETTMSPLPCSLSLGDMRLVKVAGVEVAFCETPIFKVIGGKPAFVVFR